jgi:hypothetical protein
MEQLAEVSSNAVIDYQNGLELLEFSIFQAQLISEATIVGYYIKSVKASDVNYARFSRLD